MALYYVTVSFRVEADNQDAALNAGVSLGYEAAEFTVTPGVKFSGDVEAEAASELELDWLARHGEV